MTSHVARLYVAAGSLLAFFLAWAGIAAQPWASRQGSASAARERAVGRYEQRLRRDAALLTQLSAGVVNRTSAPRIRVVTLPPLTTTRTS